jgi:phenylacetate-CoA ligase
MMPAAAARAARRMLLAHAKRIPPEVAVRRSRDAALRAVRSAARQSPAYRLLLREHGIDPSRLGRHLTLEQLPVLTKAGTFGRFPLDQLARPVRAADLADVLTSSGRSGSHFGFRLSERGPHESSWFGIDLGLEDAFAVDTAPTLLVNCLPMGVVFRSRAVTVANVSVREDMACAILRDLGPRFGQTLLCTDPLFVRRLLDHGRAVGVDWAALNTSVIVGEEMLVEGQRDFIVDRMGMDLDGNGRRIVASSFGVGELGLNLLFESRETIRIRRAARRLPELGRLICGRTDEDSLPAVFCYSPQRVCVEVLDPDADGFGELCFSMLGRTAVIPLPRFVTGDVGRLLSPHEAAVAARAAGVPTPWLPVVLLRGRQPDRESGRPSVEALKDLVYADIDDAERLTGAFIIDSAPGVPTTVRVQARMAADAADRDLQTRLQHRLARSFPTATLHLVEPEHFPGRPVVDFERKFAYMGSFADDRLTE